MRIILGSWIVLLAACSSEYSQPLTLDAVTSFDNRLTETSGLIPWQQGLISHNDSGNAGELFMLTTNGEIKARLSITADQHDWEAIAVRGNTVYVADTGNNSGRRRDLAILPFTLQQGRITAQPSLPVVYSEQTHFQPAPHQHNFDGEALTWVKDELWLFTKRWLDQKTALYKIPTTGDATPLQAQQLLNTDMLVTGADFDATTNTLLLLGYSRNWWHRKAWIWLYPVQDGRVLEHQGQRLTLSENGQFEGIALGQDGLIYVTREGHDTNLFRSRLPLATILAK